MKKQILSLALVAGIVGMMAAGCSSEKSANGSDSAKVDSAATTTTAPADTAMKPDTTKKDTTKTPPKM